jgi:enoyl-CoA hydratase
VSSPTCFEVEHLGKVAHLRLVRPEEYNSMTRAFWRELPEIITGLDAAGETRAVVISSTGKHFSAGMDLGVFTGADASDGGGDLAGGPAGGREPGRRRAALRQMVLALQDSFNAIERARMPVLAAVQGGCVGGAVDLVSACDIRYCSADAFFVVQEINLGMTADVGTLQRLPKIIPDGVAREMAYRGHRLGAQRAREIGLVNEVFDTHEDLVAGVLDIAGEIATKSPLAVWGSKQMLNYSRDHSVADSLEYVATWQAGMFHPEDMMESFAAKADKRPPDFEDLGRTPRGL